MGVECRENSTVASRFSCYNFEAKKHPDPSFPAPVSSLLASPVRPAVANSHGPMVEGPLREADITNVDALAVSTCPAVPRIAVPGFAPALAQAVFVHVDASLILGDHRRKAGESQGEVREHVGGKHRGLTLGDLGQVTGL